MAFDPSTAIEFDPTSAVEASAFDPNSAVEFDPSSAEEVKPPRPTDAPTASKEPKKSKKEKEPLFTVKKLNELRVDMHTDPLGQILPKGSSAAVGATADVASSIISFPLSWMTASETFKNTGDPKKAMAALETTREWGSIRKWIQHYAEKAGADSKALEETLYAPNFVDHILETLDREIVEKSARKVGFKDVEEAGLKEMGKTLWKDMVMLLGPMGIAKGIKLNRELNSGKMNSKSTIDPYESVKEALAKREETVQLKPTQGEQGELFPAKGEQLEMQFGEGKPFDPVTATLVDESSDMMLPRQEIRPKEVAEGQMDLPLERTQEDLFTPIQQPRDVMTGQAKNPYLDPTTVKAFEDPGFIEGRFPGPDAIELPKIGVLEDSTGTLKDANLPFSLTGKTEWLRTFGALSPEEQAKIREVSKLWTSLDVATQVANDRPIPPEILEQYPQFKELVRAKEFFANKEDVRETRKLMGEKAVDWVEAKKKITYLRTFGGLSPEELNNTSKLIPRLFKKYDDHVKKKIDSLVSPYLGSPDPWGELIKNEQANKASGFGKDKDLSLAGATSARISSKNQVPMIVKHPAVTLGTNQVKGAELVKQTLIYSVAPKILEFEKLAGSIKTENKILSVLVELQKQKHQEVGKKSGTPEATDAQLKSLGLTEAEIPAFRKVREINDRMLEILKQYRKELDGKELETPVWSYHPRSYGQGEFALIITAKEGDKVPLLFHRFKTYKEMAEARENFKQKAEAAGELQKYDVEYSSKMKSFENPFVNMDSTNIPHVIQKILEGIEEKIETRKRTFEMNRVATDIGGLAQFLDGAPDPALRDIWHQYMNNVFTFAKNVELFKVQRDILKHRDYFEDKSYVYNYLKNMIQDELGQDIAIKPMRALEKSLLTIGDNLNKGKLTVQGVKFDADDFTISSHAVRGGARSMAAGASALTLLFNTNNAIVNALQMPLTGVVGLPLDIIGRLRANPVQLAKWTTQMNIEFASAMAELALTQSTGKPTRASKILDRYSKEGQVQAHMFDELTQNRVLNTAKKWTNDLFIEQPTNATALLYYDILINDVAKAHLLKHGITPKQISELPRILAKSWVGDYTQFAKPMYLRELGVVGDTFSNFATWSHNQAGRFFEALSDIKDGDPRGVAYGMAYTFAMWSIYAHLAGGQNSPVFSTVDTVRTWYNQSRENDEEQIPSLNFYAREYGIPNWAFPQDTLLDKTQEAMGIEHPIDLSTGQRFANPLQMNMVTPSFWYGLATAFSQLDKMYSVFGSAGMTEPDGTTRKKMLEATKRLPVWARSHIQQEFGTFPRPDGTRAVQNRFDNFSHTQKDDTEVWLNKYLGVKTVRQRKEQEETFHLNTAKRNLEKEPRKMKEALISQTVQWLNNEKTDNDFTNIDQILKNYWKYKKEFDPLYDNNGKDFERDLTTRLEAMILSPKEEAEQDKQKVLEGKTRSAAKVIKLRKLLEIIKRYE